MRHHNLSGQVALITGASSGLGAHFAEVLASAGAGVALAARRADRLQMLAERLQHYGNPVFVTVMDVDDVASIQAAVAAVWSGLGPIQILINNSGVADQARLVDVDPDGFDRIMRTNLRGAFFVAQAVARRMIEGNINGRLINIASSAGLRPIGQLGVYSMSKAALVMATRAMALEWGRHDIRVNAMCPGYIETPMNEEYFCSPDGERLLSTLPRRRLGRLCDLDALLLLLADEEGSDLINGQAIAADDGLATF